MSEQLSPKAIIAESIIENFEAISSYVVRQSLRDMLDENKTLRAENARLRGLLAEIQYDCEHIGGIQHLDKAERRTWVSVANRIKDALQPERGEP